MKPLQGDAPAIQRRELFSYSDYVEKWDALWNLLSKEAIHRGALDNFIERSKGARGTTDVDDDFLLEMERWRDQLAHNIALRNPTLSQREVNSAVQTTIDRIVFLRICEDRGIEPENGLRDATDGKEVYSDLMELFKRADRKYNSGLFHFENEKGQSSHPDTLTPAITIDDKVLKDILANLYPPKSPYAFKYFSADILGQVYERFLGKVITLSEGHRAKVEEKPEVRKAGGVYYTPTYIVDYIVKNTVGELLADKTPETLETTPLRVLDPACGSGSFLLGAYQYLLDWYLGWYEQNDSARWEKGKNPPIFSSRGGWQLTMEKKKDILTRHIYGVDIDAQAVEVTKLSLLLKVVENPGQLTLLGERILPDLGNNIKCGNSLIGPDFYDGQQLTMFDSEEQYRVNAFDWQAAFPQVFSVGGFDAVIGNPPYLFITELSKVNKDYFQKAYSTSEYRFDVYGLFIELTGKRLARVGGVFAFIIPHTLLSNDSFTKLRAFLLDSTFVRKVIDIGPDVFEGARNETMILVASRGTEEKQTEVILTNSSIFPIAEKTYLIGQKKWKENVKSIWLVKSSKDIEAILRKIETTTPVLGDICTINQGLRTGDNEKYISEIKRGEMWKPVVGGKNIGRYEPLSSSLFVLYDPQKLDAPRKKWIFESPEKIIIQEIRNITLIRRLIATIDLDQTYCLQSTNVINLRPQYKDKTSLRFLLGIINSSLINFYFRQRFTGNNHIASNQLSQIPLVSPTEQVFDSLQQLVSVILLMKKQITEARLPEEKERLERQIAITDRQIDALVYELYGLTEEEIKIVEGDVLA